MDASNNLWDGKMIAIVTAAHADVGVVRGPSGYYDHTNDFSSGDAGFLPCGFILVGRSMAAGGPLAAMFLISLFLISRTSRLLIKLPSEH